VNKGPVGVAAIAALNPDGELLMGKRADDGSWCCPGGHIEAGENPLIAAHRELEEETGLTVDGMEPIDAKAVKDGEIQVYAFKAMVEGQPNGDQDPDAEFTEFRWVDPKAMPQEILRNLHNEPDVVLEALGAGGEPWRSFDEEAA
jgi:8-oxo-dGTP pyrophosphatase MutT (NUDIX family)